MKNKLIGVLAVGALLVISAIAGRVYEKIFTDQTTTIVGTPEVFLYSPRLISAYDTDSVYARVYLGFANTDTVDYDSIRVKVSLVAYPFADASLQAPTTLAAIDTFYMVVAKASTYAPTSSNDTLLYFSHAVSRNWSALSYKIQMKAKQGSASPWTTTVRTVGEASFKRPQ